MKGWHIDNNICISKNVCDGSLVGIFVCVCAEVYLYVGLYEGVYVEDDNGAGFLVVCVVLYIQDKTNTRMIRINLTIRNNTKGME